MPDFNRRFTVSPAQPQSAFTPLAGINLDLLLSAQHERVVRNDNTVTFQGLILQLPTTRERMHFVRCPVIVHQFPNGHLGVSYQGRLLARYEADAAPLPAPPIRSAPAVRTARPAPRRRPARRIALPVRIQNRQFFARAPGQDEERRAKNC